MSDLIEFKEVGKETKKSLCPPIEDHTLLPLPLENETALLKRNDSLIFDEAKPVW